MPTIQLHKTPPVYQAQVDHLLPKDWVAKVLHLVDTHAQHVVKQGRGPGSLEDEATAGLDYHVIAGDVLREHAAWLWAAYLGPLRQVVAEAVGGKVWPPAHTSSSVNVNVLRAPKLAEQPSLRAGRYELHTDEDPYAVVLFVTTHEHDGELELHVGSGRVQHVRSREGRLAIFDGAAIPHAVAPIDPGTVRISIPMVYLPDGYVSKRDPGADAYQFQHVGSQVDPAVEEELAAIVQDANKEGS